MREAGRIGLPVLAIKRANRNVEFLPVIKAAIGDRHAIRVRARNIIAFHAASFAEEMLGRAGVEGVTGERIFALQELEAACGHNDMDVAGHSTDRAITVFCFQAFGQIDLEPYRAAMASACVLAHPHHDI